MAPVTEASVMATHEGAMPLNFSTQQKLPALIPRKKKLLRESPTEKQERPSLPSPPKASTLNFVKPSRRILSPHDHQLFLRSPTYDLILAFVFSLSEACIDTKISSVDLQSQQPVIHLIVTIFAEISLLVDANPPEDQGSSRFGNPAYRRFMDALYSHMLEYHIQIGVPSESIIEISTYLEHSFGSRERIDYGSGHELNFVIWLLCLNRLDQLPPATFRALSLIVFPHYIKLLRKIQSTYYLEPAGSHGVWGLDDYQFLPFLFGASQLLHHPYIRPLGIHSELILEEEGDDYMYLDMVRYTVATKTVKGLKWTQPMLDDISGAKNWEKVEQGMKKMFIHEVLGKLPIMQHFLFGTLISAVEGMGQTETTSEGTNKEYGPGHVHADDQWGDCCGIKLPSSVAAANEARKWETGGQLRRVPFD